MKPVKVRGQGFIADDVLAGLADKKVSRRTASRTSVQFITTIMGQSRASAMLALGLVTAKKFNQNHASDGRFESGDSMGTRPKGGIAELQVKVEAEALAYVKEQFLTRGRAFADPAEYKDMKANIWDWQHEWKDAVSQRIGQTWTGKDADSFMPGKVLSKLTHDDVQALMSKNDIQYPNVKVVDNLGEFTVAGKTFKMDGEFDPNSREVRIGSHLTKEEAVGIIKHEVQHAHFDSVKSKFLPAIDAMKQDLQRGGRVTAYASDWWDAVGKGTAKYHDAVDETLAEIATLSAKQYAKVDSHWRSLYTMVTEAAKAK